MCPYSEKMRQLQALKDKILALESGTDEYADNKEYTVRL
jgi:hypothetical protein